MPVTVSSQCSNKKPTGSLFDKELKTFTFMSFVTQIASGSMKTSAVKNVLEEKVSTLNSGKVHGNQILGRLPSEETAT